MPRSPPPPPPSWKQNYPSNPHPLEKYLDPRSEYNIWGWGGGGWVVLQLHSVTLSLPHLCEAYTIHSFE